jgi:hypothetical protein
MSADSSRRAQADTGTPWFSTMVPNGPPLRGRTMVVAMV